jgi:hypothetical protein
MRRVKELQVEGSWERAREKLELREGSGRKGEEDRSGGVAASWSGVGEMKGDGQV